MYSRHQYILGSRIIMGIAMVAAIAGLIIDLWEKKEK